MKKEKAAYTRQAGTADCAGLIDAGKVSLGDPLSRYRSTFQFRLLFMLVLKLLAQVNQENTEYRRGCLFF